MSQPIDPFSNPPEKQGFQQSPNQPPAIPGGNQPGRLPYTQAHSNYGTGQTYGQVATIPKAQTVLILGILSLVFVGLIGCILAVIALSEAKPGLQMIRQYPGQYTDEGKLKTGRVLAIISLCIFGFLLLFLAGFLIFAIALS